MKLPLLSVWSSRSWLLIPKSCVSPLFIFFYPFPLLFCSCFLQTVLPLIVFLLLWKPHICHHNAEYTKYLCFFPSKTQLSVTHTQVSLLKILCFLSPAVKQWNIILAFILQKEVSIIIEPVLILSRVAVLLLPRVIYFKLVQANHSTRLTSSKIPKKPQANKHKKTPQASPLKQK